MKVLLAASLRAVNSNFFFTKKKKEYFASGGFYFQIKELEIEVN